MCLALARCNICHTAPECLHVLVRFRLGSYAPNLYFEDVSQKVTGSAGMQDPWSRWGPGDSQNRVEPSSLTDE